MSDTPSSSAGESEKDFEPTPAGQQKRWMMEFAASRKELKKWHEAADKIIKRYLDERRSQDINDTRWNLFSSDIDTLKALLYGKTPTVDVTRRFNDAKDDEARVASMMLERLLNSDIERDDDGFAPSVEYALEDKLLPGLGNVRLRYVCEWEDVPEEPAQTEPIIDEMGQPVLDEEGQPQTRELAPAVPAHQKKSHEDVETDHVYWRDQLWSPARTFHELRWWAFKASTTRKEGIKRFGAIFKLAPMNSKRASAGAESDSADAEKQDPWARADVWEVWDKESRQVFWLVEGMDKILESKPDPLGLRAFWPFPRPMIANATTSKFVPRPDFILSQDLYDEIDAVSTRITRLERAIKAVGLYDKESGDIQRLMDEACENELIPASNWARLVEKGGLVGAIQMLPIEPLVAALGVLRDYRTELINALRQINGMSDIMRGQAQASGVTATEQAIKAKFGSIRIQRRQDEFARFASDVQRIRAEIICLHFDIETIIERSNIGQSEEDETLIMKAAELLKNDLSSYRIVVKPENVSLADYAANKQEMTEVITAVGGFLNQIVQVGMAAPWAVPGLLRIMQNYVARLRGGDEIEGIIDEMVAEAKQQLEKAAQAAAQPQQPPPPDPKVQAAALKAQGDVAKTHAATSGRLTEIAAETHAGMAERAHDAVMSIAEDEAKDRRDALRGVEKIIPGQPGATP